MFDWLKMALSWPSKILGSSNSRTTNLYQDPPYGVSIKTNRLSEVSRGVQKPVGSSWYIGEVNPDFMAWKRVKMVIAKSENIKAPQVM